MPSQCVWLRSQTCAAWTHNQELQIALFRWYLEVTWHEQLGTGFWLIRHTVSQHNETLYWQDWQTYKVRFQWNDKASIVESFLLQLIIRHILKSDNVLTRDLSSYKCKWGFCYMAGDSPSKDVRCRQHYTTCKAESVVDVCLGLWTNRAFPKRWDVTWTSQHPVEGSDTI